MAAEEPVNADDEIDVESEKAKKTAKYDTSSTDLEKVTDYVEEAEISGSDIGAAMQVMRDQNVKEAVEKRRREKELSKVKIKNEDVDLIVQEMEISKQLAERKLREHKGNVVEALIELTN